MHDVLVGLANDLSVPDSNWERRGRAYRGFLRVMRAEMDTILELDTNDAVDWQREYEELRSSIDDILKEVG